MPVTSVQVFTALAKRKPSAFNLSSARLGTLDHLAADPLGLRTGTHVLHIPDRDPGAIA